MTKLEIKKTTDGRQFVGMVAFIQGAAIIGMCAFAAFCGVFTLYGLAMVGSAALAMRKTESMAEVMYKGFVTNYHSLKDKDQITMVQLHQNMLWSAISCGMAKKSYVRTRQLVATKLLPHWLLQPCETALINLVNQRNTATIISCLLASIIMSLASIAATFQAFKFKLRNPEEKLFEFSKPSVLAAGPPSQN
ncbi:hypothetical protein HELRODRAFT_163663 [Helobdella robusta]|uniref:Uncharacterized protein n=1 Tax=Helobdella robusta TaxID=6412 RepID=T1EUC0_HELRO|nr:hypothetical protein HELRODRAFT_163663 [Helobdella robusta]ESN96584.1 hypothetical protein HELRODRAFT_163663 [Helobdella robusta]